MPSLIDLGIVEEVGMRRFFLLAALVAALSFTASAGTVVLTFGAFQDGEEVLDYFNGGTGSLGTGPGPNYGITFGSDSLAFINMTSGGSLNSQEEPSGTDAGMIFLSGSGDLMDVPAGFTSGFSFYYAAPGFPGSVSVYSGLDGTGSLLATLTLPLTADAGNPGCLGYDYCPYVPIGVTFSGTAESVLFSGTANYIVFDDITLGSSIAGGGGGPTSGTPEPATFGLIGLGLATLGVISRRRGKDDRKS